MLTSDRAGAFGNGDLNADRSVASASLTLKIFGSRALRCTCRLHSAQERKSVSNDKHKITGCTSQVREFLSLPNTKNIE